MGPNKKCTPAANYHSPSCNFPPKTAATLGNKLQCVPPKMKLPCLETRNATLSPRIPRWKINTPED